MRTKPKTLAKIKSFNFQHLTIVTFLIVLILFFFRYNSNETTKSSISETLLRNDKHNMMEGLIKQHEQIIRNLENSKLSVNFHLEKLNARLNSMENVLEKLGATSEKRPEDEEDASAFKISESNLQLKINELEKQLEEAKADAAGATKEHTIKTLTPIPKLPTKSQVAKMASKYFSASKISKIFECATSFDYASHFETNPSSPYWSGRLMQQYSSDHYPLGSKQECNLQITRSRLNLLVHQVMTRDGTFKIEKLRSQCFDQPSP